MVESAAAIRVSSLTSGTPPAAGPSAASSGTLKSTRTSTLLPCTSRSSMLLIDSPICRAPSRYPSSRPPASAAIPVDLDSVQSQKPLCQIHKPVRVAPLVVVPGHDLQHRPV